MNFLADQRRLTFVTITLLIGLLGFFGSGYSIGVAGAMLYSAASLAVFPDRMKSLPSSVILFSLAGAIYFLSGVLMVLNDTGQGTDWSAIVKRLPFLFIVPLYAQGMVLTRSELIRCLKIGVPIATLGIFIWMAYQIYIWVGLEAYRGNYRFSGGAGNPGPFATICILFFALNMGLAFLSQQMRSTILHILFALVCAVGIIGSGIRAAYPLLLLLPAILLWLNFNNLKFDRSSIRIVLFSTLALGVILLASYSLWFPRINVALWELSNNGLNSNAYGSIGVRLGLWSCAISHISIAPIFGWGPIGAIDQMQLCTSELLGKEMHFTHYHNFILNALMFGGVIELLAVTLLMICVPFHAICQLYRGIADNTLRFAAHFILVLCCIFLMLGSFSIMLGHDIHDFIFLHMNVVLLAILTTDDQSGLLPQ